MTAEIAVMNRSAVALAADSAVTVALGDSAKVYNKANKLFALSKYHPVGVMFYGNANFMHVPLETIIKEFRKNIGTKKYVKIGGYADAFIKFLVSYVPCSDKQQKQQVYEIWSSQLENLNKSIHHALLHARERGVLSEADTKIITRNAIREAFEKIKGRPDAPSMANVNVVNVVAQCGKEYAAAKSSRLPGRSLTAAANKALKEYCQLLLSKTWFSPISSGIVVAGFGDKEMFPGLLEYKTDGVIGGELKIERVAFQDIARDNRSSIQAFAQGEMVVQFMEGGDREYRAYFENAIGELVSRITETIIKRYSQGTELQKKQRAGQVKRTSQKMLSELLNDARVLRRNYFVAPVIRAIGVLPMEDLANLAEALVNLTSLKRRVSMDIETVGGDIDVAVISKGDGFIWIKRKHYFDAGLNPHFFANYFRGESMARRPQR